MSGNFSREWWFFQRDRQSVATVVVALLLATLAVSLGARDIILQQEEIRSLRTSTLDDLQSTLNGQPDPGSAAYYGFRFVYDPPSDLAFAARGVRDQLPWKHRLRMLALEGQIYEHDSGNPELTQLGRIDFAFLVSVLAPLLIILMLHDVVDQERRGGRLHLLSVTAGNAGRLVRWRAVVRLLMLSAALLLPFVAAALTFGADLVSLAQLVVATIAYVIFWGVAVVWIAGRTQSAATAATIALGVWITLTLAIPLSAAAIAERQITLPQGGEILMQQRETVNRAWDLPEEDTMNAFVDTHPEWSDYTATGDGFEWKWYYAFQQVGDQSVSDSSAALRRGVRQRDAFMGKAALISPPLLIDRLFTRIANTDVIAYQRYEACARDYHAYIRNAHYPMLFGAEEYDLGQLLALDNIRACS